MVIRYANYLVSTKTDLEIHLQNKLLEKTDDYILRSSANLKQCKLMVLKGNSTPTR